mgnify:CR=1 FL=1
MRSCRAILSLFSHTPTQASICSDISDQFKSRLKTLIGARKRKYHSYLDEGAKLDVKNWSAFEMHLKQAVSEDWVRVYLQEKPAARRKLIDDLIADFAALTALDNLKTKDGIWLSSRRSPYFPTITIHYELPKAVLEKEIAFKLPALTV